MNLDQDFRTWTETVSNLTKVNARFDELYQERCARALDRFVDAAGAASSRFGEKVPGPPTPWQMWRDATAYWLDGAQRATMFADTLRRRGNAWLDHEKAGKPPLLAFEWRMVADARRFERPVNYALVEIVPPKGVTTNPELRPFVIIDPRAGHGPGIGGFKQDSQVGVALRAGHPVYFVIFFPDPEPGQTLADVSLAESEFLRIVADRHPQTPKPVLIGNCQGGWAAMLLGAVAPERLGPLVINGAPMSYWAGNDGENPMRYAGGMLGGVWPALLASDLGGGVFDGAYLVDNFEYLNPANTYFDKLYNLYARIDTERPRYLEFERWWGGFFLMGRQEIAWIVENLFVGNDLAAGDVEWSEGRHFDLREIRSPIIIFASLGDNITPPQQAFNWVADLYPTTEALKANGQVIVGLMHESVGHLGIFVSGQIARREHAQIVDLIGQIERLPPGLYGMQIEEKREGGEIVYDVLLTERRVEDLQILQRFQRRDEMPFAVVEATSERLAQAYETFVHPFAAAVSTPALGSLARALHPQRVQRWAWSDLNPWLRPLGMLSDLAEAHRVRRHESGPFAAAEALGAAMVSASLDLYRDLRDAAVELSFFRLYGPPAVLAPPEEGDEVGFGIPEKDVAFVRDALLRIGEGDRTTALVRIALLFARAGTGQRRLSGMKTVRQLAGDAAGLDLLPVDDARRIIREQSYIVDLEPETALATLPQLLPGPEDRRVATALIARVAGALTINARQTELIERIGRILTESPTEPTRPRIVPSEPPSQPERAAAERSQARRRPAR